MRETIVLNGIEQKRALVLNQVMAGQMKAEQAADLLQISLRHTRRLLAAYRQEGPAALAHGNRGRQPAHTLAEGLRQRVVALAREKYAGFNHQHLSEVLGEEEEITISRSTLRRILLGAGLPSPRKRRPPKHRRRRERYPREGMLLQTDGSRHDWLEGRGPYLTLLGAIDDATNEVPYALFREQEDTQGYMLLFGHIVAAKGVPLAVYHDRHGIFECNAKGELSLAEQLGGGREATQFGRALAELAIGSIVARTPQAKGRIERLWGTFQDRLTSALRLAGAQDLAAANRVLGAFLPRFNRRFAVPAAEAGSAYRPLGEGIDLAAVFCFKYRRTVNADNVVALGDERLQLTRSPARGSYAHARVEVHEHLDGSLGVFYQGQPIGHKPAPPEAPLPRSRHRGGARAQPPRPEQPSQPDPAPKPVPASSLPTAPRRPAHNHPWRTPGKGVLAQRTATTDMRTNKG
jgi:transposase